MDWDFLIPVGTVLITLVGVIGMAARSLRTTSQAIGELSKTNIALNKELHEMARDRHAIEQEHEKERVTWKLERTDLQGQLDGVTAKLTRIESDFALYRESSQQVIDNLGQELVKVKRELESARQEALSMKQSIRDLTAALKAAQEQIQLNDQMQQQWKAELAEAKQQIAELQRDNLTKDHEIQALTSRVKELESKLEVSENARAALERREKELLARLAELQEPGEHDKPVEPEKTEESKEEN